MQKPRHFLILTLLILSNSETVLSDVYKHVDRNGNVEYTDTPGGSGYRLIIKTPAAFSKSIRASFGGKRQTNLSNTGLFSSPTRHGSYDSNQPPHHNHRHYDHLIRTAASQNNLDPALLHAVIRAESSYNPAAVSNKGAVGLMQLMPGTAARYGVRNPYDPEENVSGGARYLSDLLGMFSSDVRLAVAAYNAGENNVVKYGNRVPPFHETQNYVSKVLGFYNSYDFN